MIIKIVSNSDLSTTMAMMKNTLTLIAALAAAIAFGQDYTREQVVPTDSVPASELYARAKRWFVDTYKDAGSVLEMEDPVTSTLVGNGSMPYSTSVFMNSVNRAGSIHYTIEVNCKDGRYRCAVRNVIHTSDWVWQIMSGEDCCPMYRMNTTKAHAAKVCKDELMPQVDTYFTMLEASLKAAMTAPAKDW